MIEFASMQVEQLMLPLLWQLALIIIAARAVGVLFRKFGQPEVVGEITAGLLLGPSFFGLFFPEWSRAIFQPEVQGLPPGTLHWIFTVISQIGLVLLLFLVGMEFDFGHLKVVGASTAVISLSGIVVPFGLGMLLAWSFFPVVFPDNGNGASFWGFALFLGTAMAITALPILGRMMVEWDIPRTRLAVVTITAAAIDDAAGWILLAGVAAGVTTGFELKQSLVMVLSALAFGLAMVFLVRPCLKRILPWFLKDGELSVTGLAVILTLLFLSAIATNLIGVFGIFGAFLFGACLCDERELRLAVQKRLRDFVTAFFLPIFFAYTGLRTNIGMLDTWQLWGVAAAVIGASIVGKAAGCGLAARWTGFSTREAACIGVLMNTRALMELIVINLGKDLGVIPDSVFCMLVMMALLTTVMTTPLITRLANGTELEPYLGRGTK